MASAWHNHSITLWHHVCHELGIIGVAVHGEYKLTRSLVRTRLGKVLELLQSVLYNSLWFQKTYYWSYCDWIPSPKVSWGATLTRIRSSTVPPGAQTSTELSLEAEKRSRACIQERKWVTQPACSLVHKVMCPLSMSHHLITPSIRVIKVTCHLCGQEFTSGRIWNFYLYIHTYKYRFHLYA